MNWFRVVIAVCAVIVALSAAAVSATYVMDQRGERAADSSSAAMTAAECRSLARAMRAKGQDPVECASVTKPGVNAPKLPLDP